MISFSCLRLALLVGPRIDVNVVKQTKGLAFFLGQRISIAIQRGNAASLLSTFPVDIDADEFFDALLFFVFLFFSPSCKYFNFNL